MTASAQSLAPVDSYWLFTRRNGRKALGYGRTAADALRWLDGDILPQTGHRVDARQIRKHAKEIE